MANIYVRSTDGLDADNGSTWALAKATLTGAAAIDVAGDRIFVSDNHAESTAAALSFAWAGTDASQTYVLCVDDSAEPPTALARTATVTTTGNNSINVNSSGIMFLHGISFRSGTGANNTTIALNSLTSGLTTYRDCEFQIIGTGGAGGIVVSGGQNTKTTFINCDVRFSSTGQNLRFTGNGIFEWHGGKLMSGSTTPTNLFDTLGVGVYVLEGIDLSNAAATINLTNSTSGAILWVMRNSRLPASWSGSLNSAATIGRGSRYELFNCDSGDTNYKVSIRDTYGTIVDETTLVRAGARTDGTTNVTMKCVTNATAEYPMLWLRLPDIAIWNDTVGSSVTVEIPFLHDDSVDARTNEIGMDVWYAGTSGVPLYVLTTTDEDMLGSPSFHADASGDDSWTTTGMTNPNPQRMSLTFTPQEKGFIIIRPKVYEASKTVYIDGDPQIS